MYLKRVRLRGFKSFARVTDLVFEPGVAVVIGPNGSGKSNLAEAVMWALGEQSPSSLRGASMQDVIFAGSDGRRASGGAEVELVFDNADGALPLPAGEVSVSRRVERNGQTTYRINRSTCRLADVTELMSSVGLGRAGHAVIGQGRVEWFLSSKPADRRALIEEAAGLGRYKRRRERALLKLNETQRNLERVEDLEREVAAQLAPLRRQASAAEQLRATQTELAELRGRLLAGDLLAVQREVAEARTQMAAAESEKQAIDAALAEIEARRGAEEERFARLLEERERRSQRQLRARVLLGRLESCARLTEQRVRLLEELTRASTAERDRLLVELGGVESHGDDDWPAEHQRLLAALQAAGARHAEVAAQVAAERKALAEARADLVKAGAEREEVLLRAARLRERRAALAAEVEGLSRRVELLDRQAADLAQAVAAATSHAAKTAADAEVAQAGLERADAADAAAREALAAAEGRVRELAGAAAAAAAERDHVAASVGGLGDLDVELARAVEAFPGVAALAASLDCDPGYERALGAALSRLEGGVHVPPEVDPWAVLEALRAAGARLVRLVLPLASGHGSDAVAGVGSDSATGSAARGGEPLAPHVRGAQGRVAKLLATVVVVDDLRTVPDDLPGLAVTRDGGFYAPAAGELGVASASPAAVALEGRALLRSLEERARTLQGELAAARRQRDECRVAADEAARARREASRLAVSAREAAQAAERALATAEERLRAGEAERDRAVRDHQARLVEMSDLDEGLERLDVAAAELLVRAEKLAGPLAEAEEALRALEERHDAALAALTRVRVELEERTAAAERAARERADAERRRAAGRARLEVLERR